MRMAVSLEKQLLQAVVALACVVPLVTGGSGVLHGPHWLRGVGDVPIDLASQFAYISGIFFGVGVAFTTCVPNIEHKGPRFRLLGALVVMGGLSRLYALLTVGVPSTGHMLGLSMELAVVPCLMAWQMGLARRAGVR